MILYESKILELSIFNNQSTNWISNYLMNLKGFDVFSLYKQVTGKAD
ncbi:hypothetical protein HMPREF9104_00101 [Lentilactobacillus kisonensis F0435]|uniref:Uncharacterized protein n=1 Tax=Lentilactobacillus kisonensis F0435 TaxID=797516 RepID=H1LBZ0_9LACO|nr:hypothetical protein HMPREF9104_00101 [Lentilactobacillus kisonensis F0435]